jgi:2-methylcitrate dehydratase PrpD
MGNGFKTHMDYLEGRLPLNPDSDVIKFARRIKMHYAPDLDEKYRNFVADVTVQYVDGTSEQIFRECWKGSSAIPFTREEHWTKLDELTEGVIGTKQAAELFGLIDRLDPTAPVGTITALLQRP